MNLLTFKDISLEFGEQRILKQASFSIEAGERVCLIGRNGAGKSTLFKIITNQIIPDSGDIKIKTNLRVSQLEQTLPAEQEDTVYDYVARGLEKLQALLAQYEQQAHKALDKAGLRELEKLQYQIEASGGWKIDPQIQSTLSELGLPPDKKLTELSGGWQRRAALAKALVSQPELLLLDEPTNHLDLSTIQWLENKAYAFAGSILFVTHDRAFLQGLATRILELDRGKLTSWPGNYKRFLFAKEKFLEEEARNNALFDKRLEQEEAWIRQGIKARRTRNEGRVRALQTMREVYAQRVKPENSARISVEAAERSGRKVIDAHNITHGYGHEPLINGLHLKIRRGDRIGLIGNNGVGKSTLLKILLGEISPQRGTVKLGTHLQIGYFDQHRRKLEPEKTILEMVGDGSDYIKVDGKDRHVIGYLKGFLFSPKRAMTKIKVLSGGECNRVILARLFTRPTNLLILDEPTNDLDVETLEVLEERLVEYKGTLIVVSHDREFLDNVVTSTLAFEAGGHLLSYAGGYSDWLKQGKALNEADNPNQNAKQNDKPNDVKPDNKSVKSVKLSYKLQLELNQLPDKVELLEQQVNDLQAQTQQQDFYGQTFEKVQPVLNRLAAKQNELEQTIERWSELEKM